MKVWRTKTHAEDHERMKITVNKALTIFVHIFEQPEGFRCAAFNDVIHHDDLEGYGYHKSKGRSIKMAVRDLKKLMMECDNNWS